MNALGLLALLVMLGTIICFIIVLIKLFQNEGALKGILGLLCSLYTFIWGWMNANRLGIRNIMLIWTALLILSFILRFALGAGAAYSGTTVAP
ncbi:MAG TPA: hypothetical protein VGX48_16525 [Pyrinomonadaceae bacterium]|jgi:hypothetical protein|nr:hypothetical protein [Pyrinomonadaceae bacterium]